MAGKEISVVSSSEGTDPNLFMWVLPLGVYMILVVGLWYLALLQLIRIIKNGDLYPRLLLCRRVFHGAMVLVLTLRIVWLSILLKDRGIVGIFDIALEGTLDGVRGVLSYECGAFAMLFWTDLVLTLENERETMFFKRHFGIVVAVPAITVFILAASFTFVWISPSFIISVTNICEFMRLFFVVAGLGISYYGFKATRRIRGSRRKELPIIGRLSATAIIADATLLLHIVWKVFQLFYDVSAAIGVARVWVVLVPVLVVVEFVPVLCTMILTWQVSRPSCPEGAGKPLVPPS